MLSRVAENLFWMSRYLERAENVARLLDIGLLPRARRTHLDRRGRLGTGRDRAAHPRLPRGVPCHASRFRP